MNPRGLAWLGAALALALFGCGPKAKPAPAVPPPAPAAPAAAVGSLAWAAQGRWRIEPERDKYRHPVETLSFFGVTPGMTVVEVFAGRGWYTSILAPYLARGGGKLYEASFDPLTASPAQLATIQEFKARFMQKRETFGAIELSVLSPTSGPIAPDNSADMALVMRNVHTFMAEGYAEKAFRDIYASLKPGGILGIEEHRAKSTGLQDPQAGDGYVQEAFVKMLAQEAGFEFVGSSEINANPRDTKDYPFGVWTLPPVLRSAPLGVADNPRFDHSKYVAIGESDRMTLKFRKPVGTDPGAKAARR
jgi:predicted methyltransferase